MATELPRNCGGASAARALALLVGWASHTPLMPVPRLYTGDRARPLFTAVDPEEQESSIDLLYVTKRAPRAGPEEPLPYTSDLDPRFSLRIRAGLPRMSESRAGLSSRLEASPSAE